VSWWLHRHEGSSDATALRLIHQFVHIGLTWLTHTVTGARFTRAYAGNNPLDPAQRLR